MTNEETIKWLKLLNTSTLIYGEYSEAIDVAIEALSADRPKGEWKWSESDVSWMCGRCGCVFEEIDWRPDYNFCPNCGADMRGEEDCE